LLAGGFRSTTHSGTPGGTIFINFVITIFINFVITIFIDIIITVDFINCGQQDGKRRSNHL
jgi:hypothetical protein